MYTPRQLKELFKQGVNISKLLRDDTGSQYNTEEIIEIIYELQAGTYIAAFDDPAKDELRKKRTPEIARTILSLCKPHSVLEAGIGEATTFTGVLQGLDLEVKGYGFDLSWSRLAYARLWLRRHGFNNVTLCTGSLLHIPFADESIDVVYTSHSIEPNRGRESPILQELFRVAKKFLILIEPAYELVDDATRRRMDFHGYCRDLKGVAESLGYNVLTHELFPYPAPTNPSAITIIQKTPKSDVHYEDVFVCPRYKTALKKIGGMLFSPEALVVYPVLDGIPCLRIENGILASKYQEILESSFGDRAESSSSIK